MRVMSRVAILIGCLRVVAASSPAPRLAQRADPGEVRGLKLGLKAPEMTLDGFGDLACGSNGGPPRQRLDAWSEFAKCRPEASGLHEVAPRFDDEDEYISRAIEDPRVARGKIGTRVAGHPVILSVLFDRDGVVRELRFVTDPRAAPLRAPHGAHSSGAPSWSATGWTAGPARTCRRPTAKRRSAASSSSSAARSRSPAAR